MCVIFDDLLNELQRQVLSAIRWIGAHGTTKRQSNNQPGGDSFWRNIFAFHFIARADWFGLTSSRSIRKFKWVLSRILKCLSPIISYSLTFSFTTSNANSLTVWSPQPQPQVTRSQWFSIWSDEFISVKTHRLSWFQIFVLVRRQFLFFSAFLVASVSIDTR